jgi:hypothetical protein
MHTPTQMPGGTYNNYLGLSGASASDSLGAVICESTRQSSTTSNRAVGGRHRRCRHDRLFPEQQVGEELYPRQYGVDISISHLVRHDTTSLNATTQRLARAPSDGTALP